MRMSANLSETASFPPIERTDLTILQVNLGYRCNQTCAHCHVNASPKRREMMDQSNLSLIPEILKSRSIPTLDLTGGAPELHEGFRSLVKQARTLGVKVIDRCNLTILFEPGMEDLAAFLAEHQVEIVASLPCYSLENVDAQRGKGVFDKSLAALQRLNAFGYGHENSGLVLNLVYNPQGAVLPPNQQKLQNDYKKELLQHFGIVFNELFTITNMPIQRFANYLKAKKQYDDYLRLLKENFSAANLSHVMCRSLISVDWQGNLYDCDFNQQLGLNMVNNKNGEKLHMRDLLDDNHLQREIVVGNHCFGCTAGQGSSCGGSLNA